MYFKQLPQKSLSAYLDNVKSETQKSQSSNYN